MPAYGTFVAWDGHVVAAEDWHAYDGKRSSRPSKNASLTRFVRAIPEAPEGSDEWIREIRYGCIVPTWSRCRPA